MNSSVMRDIKAVAMDVDGVLTDGTFWWGYAGEELKRFCFADSTGINRALREGVKIALVSGESSESGMALVQRYADKLKIVDVYKACHDKRSAVEDFANSYNLKLSEICYIGDDFIDVAAMMVVGFAVCPADAHRTARAQAHLVTSHNGGRGAVREVLDLILEARSIG